MAMLADEGAVRAAMAALHANGGFEVVLRLPGLASSGAEAEELGLATPQFQDVPLGPAVWRKAGANSALLLAGGSVAEVLGARDFLSTQGMFQNAVGLVIAGVLYVIKDIEPLFVAGVAAAFRVTVEGPSWA